MDMEEQHWTFENKAMKRLMYYEEVKMLRTNNWHINNSNSVGPSKFYYVLLHLPDFKIF